MNTELLLQVKAAILAKPETYDQGEFCGTAHCIGGHAVFIADRKTWKKAIKNLDGKGPRMVSDRAQELLEIPDELWRDVCGYHFQWPEEFADRYRNAISNAERAQVAADRIDAFIATGGDA